MSQQPLGFLGGLSSVWQNPGPNGPRVEAPPSINLGASYGSVPVSAQHPELTYQVVDMTDPFRNQTAPVELSSNPPSASAPAPFAAAADYSTSLDWMDPANPRFGFGFPPAAPFPQQCGPSPLFRQQSDVKSSVFQPPPDTSSVAAPDAYPSGPASPLTAAAQHGYQPLAPAFIDPQPYQPKNPNLPACLQQYEYLENPIFDVKGGVAEFRNEHGRAGPVMKVPDRRILTALAEANCRAHAWLVPCQGLQFPEERQVFELPVSRDKSGVVEFHLPHLVSSELCRGCSPAEPALGLGRWWCFITVGHLVFRLQFRHR